MESIIYFQEMWQLAIDGETQGFFFWFSLYTLIVCIYSMVFQIRMRSWPYTQGDLIELGLDTFGTSFTRSDQDYKANALYNYSVSGVNYSGTRVSPWLMIVSHNLRFVLKKQMSYVLQSTDGKVAVFYNPNNPQKSFLIIPGKVGIFITLLISVLPFTLFYYKYYV